MPMPEKIIDERRDTSVSSNDQEGEEAHLKPHQPPPKVLLDDDEDKQETAVSSATSAETTNTTVKQAFGQDDHDDDEQRKRLEKLKRRQELQIRKACRIELDLLDKLSRIRAKRHRMVQQLEKLHSQTQTLVNYLPPILQPRNPQVIDMTYE